MCATILNLTIVAVSVVRVFVNRPVDLWFREALGGTYAGSERCGASRSFGGMWGKFE